VGGGNLKENEVQHLLNWIRLSTVTAPAQRRDYRQTKEQKNIEGFHSYEQGKTQALRRGAKTVKTPNDGKQRKAYIACGPAENLSSARPARGGEKVKKKRLGNPENPNEFRQRHRARVSKKRKQEGRIEPLQQWADHCKRCNAALKPGIARKRKKS